MSRCRIVRISNGSVVRVQGDKAPSPKAIKAIDNLVNIVKQQMAEGKL